MRDRVVPAARVAAVAFARDVQAAGARLPWSQGESVATPFDTRPRSDGTPALHSEDMFSFLARLDSPYGSPLHDMLEEWFAEAVPGAAPPLRYERIAPDPAMVGPEQVAGVIE